MRRDPLIFRAALRPLAHPDQLGHVHLFHIGEMGGLVGGLEHVVADPAPDAAVGNPFGGAGCGRRGRGDRRRRLGPGQVLPRDPSARTGALDLFQVDLHLFGQAPDGRGRQDPHRFTPPPDRWPARGCMGRRADRLGFGLVFARIDHHEYGPDLDGVSFIASMFHDAALDGRRDLDGGLVRHDLHHGLIFFDLVSYRNQPANDLAFHDAFAYVGEPESVRHGTLLRIRRSRAIHPGFFRFQAGILLRERKGRGCRNR